MIYTYIHKYIYIYICISAISIVEVIVWFSCMTKTVVHIPAYQTATYTVSRLCNGTILQMSLSSLFKILKADE